MIFKVSDKQYERAQKALQEYGSSDFVKECRKQIMKEWK